MSKSEANPNDEAWSAGLITAPDTHPGWLSSVSRVGRSRRVERLAPMTVRLRPLIKPDGRISRIRLSEPLHRKAFGCSVGFAVERVWEFPKLLQGCYLLRAISRFFSPLPR